MARPKVLAVAAALAVLLERTTGSAGVSAEERQGAPASMPVLSGPAPETGLHDPLLFDPGGQPTSEPVDPERDDIIGPDGEPVDLRPVSEAERRRIVEEHYPVHDPGVTAENARRYVDYLYRTGRTPKPSQAQVRSEEGCWQRYGPIPGVGVAAGISERRIKEVMRQVAEFGPSEEWARLMADPPLLDADARPMLLIIPPRDGSICDPECMYGPARVSAGISELRVKEIMREVAELSPNEQWVRLMAEPPGPETDARSLVVIIPSPDGPHCYPSTKQ